MKRLQVTTWQVPETRHNNIIFAYWKIIRNAVEKIRRGVIFDFSLSAEWSFTNFHVDSLSQWNSKRRAKPFSHRVWVHLISRFPRFQPHISHCVWADHKISICDISINGVIMWCENIDESSSDSGLAKKSRKADEKFHRLPASISWLCRALFFCMFLFSPLYLVKVM